MVSYAKSALSLLLPLAASRAVTGSGETEDVPFEWRVLDVKMPQALSDQSATYLPLIGKDAAIVLAGGCDSPNGNTYVDSTGAVLDYYICDSISEKVYAFRPDDDGGRGTFVTLADMPRARYRHAAVQIDGKLWLVGGRTVPDDSIIAEIDVYDPASDSWSTPGSLPDEYLTSDNAAFTDKDGNFLYVAGGYNQMYDDPPALSATFTIDITEALNNGNVVIQDKSPMNTPRGDAHAVNSADHTAAYMGGGFGVNPCDFLKSVEVYDIESDVWMFVDDLTTARGDMAVVELNGRIVTAGGETTHPQTCSDDPGDVPVLAAQPVAVDDVEVLDPTRGDGANWIKINDIPNFRFRFSGADWDETDTIYLFGGQNGFDDGCRCFPTTDNVLAYHVGDGTNLMAAASSSSSSPEMRGTFGGTLSAVVAGAAFGAMAFM